MFNSLSSFVLSLLPLALVVSAARANETFPGVQRPVCPESTQLALNQCAYEWDQATLAQRRQVYDSLEATLSAPEQEALATAEASWQAFESTYCALRSERYRGGSIYPLTLYSCRATRNNERTVALTQWQPEDAPFPDYFTLLPQLEAAYESAVVGSSPRELAALPGHQALWETYRDQHCAWEMSQISDGVTPESSEQLNRCFTRLTLQRMQQLRFL
ncbi:MAG: lysozyme inhibitor LprI family protein [Cyanobacteria bacterium J06632_22]